MRQVLRQVESDAAVALANAFHAYPHHLARGHQRIEIARRVIRDASRQNLTFEFRSRQCCTLENADRIEQCLHPTTWDSHSLPACEQAPQDAFLHWLDFTTKPRQRLAAHDAQN